MEAAKAKGLLASIVRPGTIGPVSAWNENDTLTKLFRGVEQLGTAPDLNPPITVAPVDWVARLVVASRKQPGTTINVVGMSAPWQSLLDMTHLRSVPLKEFVRILQRNPENALAPLLSYFGGDGSSFPLADDRAFASGAAADALALKTGIGKCPLWAPPKI